MSKKVCLLLFTFLTVCVSKAQLQWGTPVSDSIIEQRDWKLEARLIKSTLMLDSQQRFELYSILERDSLLCSETCGAFEYVFLIKHFKVNKVLVRTGPASNEIDQTISKYVNFLDSAKYIRMSFSGPGLWDTTAFDANHNIFADSMILQIFFSRKSWELIPERYGISNLQVYYNWTEYFTMVNDLSSEFEKRNLFANGERIMNLSFLAQPSECGRIIIEENLNKNIKYAFVTDYIEKHIHYDSAYFLDSDGIMVVIKPFDVMSLKNKKFLLTISLQKMFNGIVKTPSYFVKKFKKYIKLKLVINSIGPAESYATGFNEYKPIGFIDTMDVNTNGTQVIKVNDSITLEIHIVCTRRNGNRFYLYTLRSNSRESENDYSYYVPLYHNYDFSAQTVSYSWNGRQYYVTGYVSVLDGEWR